MFQMNLEKIRKKRRKHIGPVRTKTTSNPPPPFHSFLDSIHSSQLNGSLSRDIRFSPLHRRHASPKHINYSPLPSNTSPHIRSLSACTNSPPGGYKVVPARPHIICNNTYQKREENSNISK